MRKFGLLMLALALFVSFGPGSLIQVTQAQDDQMEKIACDSTLATLLLVAEHDYDYLSDKMMMDMMDDPALNIDLGVLDPIAQDIMAMMMDMADEGSTDMDTMSEEDMAMHDEMLANMMSMSAEDAVNAYLSSMNMEMMDMSMLPTGEIAGEDPACTQVRADVEQFLLAHILTEMSMMGDM